MSSHTLIYTYPEGLPMELDSAELVVQNAKLFWTLMGICAVVLALCLTGIIRLTRKTK